MSDLSVVETRALLQQARLLQWTAVGMLAAGLALRNCVLIACSTLVALLAFHRQMDAGAPWQGWRAALRCGLAGMIALAAAGGLLAMVAGAWLGWWQPRIDDSLIGFAVLALAALACWIPDSRGQGLHPGASTALALLAGAITLLIASLGWSFAYCLFAIAIALAVGWIGWTLVRSSAGELALADTRR